MSLLTVSSVLPALLFGLAVGAWVDRLRRRPVLIAADAVRVVSLGSIPVAWALDALYIEQLYFVAFVHGLTTVVFDVAYRSYVPSLVSRDQLVAANSRLSGSEYVAEVGAFSLGGWIAQLFSAIAVAAVDSVTFLVSGLLLAWVHTRELAPAPREARHGLRREIGEGVGLVLANPILRTIGGQKAASGISGGVIRTLIVLYGIETLGFGPGVLGTIFAIGGLAAVLGAVSTTRLTGRFGLGRTMAVGELLGGLGAFLIPIARGPLLLAGSLLTAQQLFDFGGAAYEINEMSLRQGITPPEVLGRVNASLQVTELGARLAGALLGGVLAETLGMRWGLTAGSCFMVAGGLLLLASPVWRVRSVTDDDSEVR